MAGNYGEEYENDINALSRVASTAKKFAEHGKTSALQIRNARQGVGPEVRGLDGRVRFDKGLRHQRKAFPGHFAINWPRWLRRIDALKTRRAMRKTVGSNVCGGHELQIKHFKRERIDHIGLLLLCLNPALQSRPQSDSVAKTAAEVAS
jgi:hypothetical protein